MLTIPVRVSTVRHRPRTGAIDDAPLRHRPAKGVMIAIVAGTGVWVAIFTGFGIL